jgi:23S rRNA pseudouridine2605 synthase
MRDRPHPQHKLEWPGGVVPEWARPTPNPNKRRGKGGGGKHERQGGSSPSKRERLQKVMAQSGHGSRRNIEILIAQGHLTINGQLAKLGDSVGPGDKVKLDGHLIHLRYGDPLPRVLMYHKPEGEIVTRDDPEKRATVFDKLPKVHGGRWVSVGRLDLNTGGLLIFTTSGELANRLTHPRFEVEREYAVRVVGELTEELKTKLLTGIDIEGDSCKFDSLEDRGGEGSNHWYHVVLREGKNREVRKMMEGAGMMVSRLMRVRFGQVLLPTFLKRGMMREMEEEQIQELLNFAGMNEPPPAAEGAEAAPGEVEDEHDNIGNRIDNNPRHREREEPDDDYGNRVQAAAAAQREADGNKGTYIPGGAPVAPARERPDREGNGPGPRRPHGHGGKPFAFGKKRGQGQGGQAHGQGQGNSQGKGQHHHRKQGQGAAQGQGHAQGQPQAHGPKPPQQGQGPAGPGKPGRGRRNKNRNKGKAGAGEARGEQQPPNNGNRDPY